MELLKKILMWILTVFMALVVVSYFPSLSTITAFIFVIIAIPIEPIQDFWFMHDVDGWKKGVLLTALFLASVILAPSGSSDDEDKSEKISKPETTEIREMEEEGETRKEDIPEENAEELEVFPVIEPKDSFDSSEYTKIDAEVLFEYGNYFSGEKVITVISAYQPGADIKAKTDNNDGYFYSLMFEFGDEDAIKWVEEGDILTIAGTIKEKPETVDALDFLETPTVTLEDCSIIGRGEIAKELKDGAAAQREVGEQAKQAYEDEIAANKKAERDDYISQCTTVKYRDVERNPDNYEGTKIKVRGEVVQVAEGWFDSVTMRVSSGGNMWYVTYSREEGESRILEGDSITCYGECDGVKSYTTVLGSQKTIPSLKMEYYS